MAKYCIHCGKKLEDGEVCDCTANAVKSQSNNLGTSLLEVLKGIFVKPIDTNSMIIGLSARLMRIF